MSAVFNPQTHARAEFATGLRRHAREAAAHRPSLRFPSLRFPHGVADPAPAPPTTAAIRFLAPRRNDGAAAARRPGPRRPDGYTQPSSAAGAGSSVEGEGHH